MDMTTGAVLPKDCIATIISFTSPRDACRDSLVSRIFASAAGLDLVWTKFLPPDYQRIISESVSSGSSSSSSLNDLSKKDLFFHLCDNPILIGNGKRSFAIDKLSGKKCYMLGARELSLGDTRGSWKWISSAMPPVRHLPRSRFWEVVHLLHVSVLEIEGRIKTEILSPNTKYGAYFVYDLLKNHSSGLPPGYDLLQVNLSIKFENENKDKAINSIYLLPKQEQSGQGVRRREDKWLEIEIGEFFNGEVDNVVVIRLSERQALNMKYGLVVHGIELRPKL